MKIQKILVDQALNSQQIRDEMRQIGVDPRGVEIMEDKFQHFVIKLFNLSFRQAAIIKQEMLARGAEAAVSWRVCSWDTSEKGGDYEALLSGTLRQFEQLIAKLEQQPFGLKDTAELIKAALNNYARSNHSITLRGKTYDLNRHTLVMGIINLTPDSFSQDGLYRNKDYIDAAVRQAQQMIADGADILDIGAESTRPGFAQLPEEEEERRLLPALKELVNAVDVPISVDTYKPGIAEKALAAGASMINDIWGLKAPNDPQHRMASIVGTSGAPVVIMHNQGQPGYTYLVKEMVDSLSESIDIALHHGIQLEQIIVDPGIGFGKTYEDNLKVLQNLDQLKVLGRPILLGTSRKSVIGMTLNLPVDERVEGTIATTVWGIAKGANIIRVHDVKAVSRAIKMCDAINQN